LTEFTTIYTLIDKTGQVIKHNYNGCTLKYKILTNLINEYYIKIRCNSLYIFSRWFVLHT